MPEPDDIALLKQYARGDESAFATLFERYGNLVYSTALRQARSPSHAEEITQAVFILLARKAGSLSPKTILSGWLYQAARLTTASLIKREVRRQRREQEVYMQTQMGPDTSLWEQISPSLDDAMGRLGEQDRNAIVLRFFENRTPQELAATLKLNEVTARKRVSRALEKLRAFFAKRGVVSTTAIIAGAISANSVHAAPAGLAQTISAVAVAKGAAASASTLTLVKGALKLMAWTNVKTAIAVGAGILLIAGAASTVTVKEVSDHQGDAAWSQIVQAIHTGNMGLLRTVPPTVSIRPTKHYLGTREGREGFWEGQSGKMLGLAVPASGVFGHAFDVIRDRIINRELLPSASYDFAVMLPDHQSEALQAAAERKFGVTATVMTVQTNVLVLTVANPDAPGLTPSTDSRYAPRGPILRGGYVKFLDVPMSLFAYELERQYETPIINETGLTNRFDVSVKWDRRNMDPDIQTVEQVLLDQLGLKLTPAVRPIKMLALEKAK